MYMKVLLRIFVRTAVAAALSGAAHRSQAAAVADPTGTFTIEDGRARVRLERCGAAQDRICGYIVWLKNPTDERGQPARDRNNPDPEKRARALLGHQLILGLKPTTAGRFEGDVYNSEDGKSYSIALWRESSDRVKVKGCLIKLLCSTQNWQQTFDVMPRQLVGPAGDVNGPKADRELVGPAPMKQTTAKAR